ncbi:MAG: methyltransferase domain-containing protein [Bacteroidales bacterium]|jgi:SAM-dependent methyltransferase|nr:methyltransferase domain-containing protein [Bacteroidales bacterium]
MERYIWVGRYEHDIKGNDIFCGSITIYGSAKGNNHSFSEQENFTSETREFLAFACQIIKDLILTSEDLRFFFLDELWAYNIIDIDSSVKKYFILLNDRDTLEFLNNKTLSRIWLSTELTIPPFISATSNECEYSYLKKYFPGKSKFIIQESVSEGGEGTFMLDESNQEQIMKMLRQSQAYSVSPYLKHSLPLNATLIIDRGNNHVVFPVSMQILSNADSHMYYIGSDFIASRNLSEECCEKINSFLAKIINKLKSCGYKGIIGVDFLIYNDVLYFIEFNPRLQGSTFLIDKAIQNAHKLSIYDFMLKTQVERDLFQNIYGNLNIALSFITNEYEHNIKTSYVPVEIITDGDKQSYTRFVYNTSLCCSQYQYNIVDYYDYFANRYHLILPDVEDSIANQGAILRTIVEKYSERTVQTILDCTCGIGIQTISLAKLGYFMYGSDISNAVLEIARYETEKRNLNIPYFQADCRELGKVFAIQFDAIISIDNSLSHLLSENDYIRAFESFYDRLHDGGIFIASFRDYDEIVKEKPVWAYAPRVKKENETTFVTVRNFEWRDDICISHQYFIENNSGKVQLFYNTYQQWAITRKAISQIVSKTSFSKCLWLFSEETLFYQPILCLVK